MGDERAAAVSLHRDLAVVAIFSDGGLVHGNPSTVGGSWAWCHVNAVGERVHEGCGLLTPDDVGLDSITNHLTETLAAIGSRPFPHPGNFRYCFALGSTREKRALLADMTSLPYPKLDDWDQGRMTG